MIRKLLPCLVLMLALAGCRDSSKPVRLEEMNKGYIHLAANLALEDVIRKGDVSLYRQFVPSPVLSPTQTLKADGIIEDFRRDYAAAENRYHPLRGTGIMVRGIVDRIDRKEREVVFVQENTTVKPHFTGLLRISLDKSFYDEAALPDFEQGTAVTFVCREHRLTHDFKNDASHQIEIRLIGCKTANDYFDEFQKTLKQRLTAIYGGKEPVSPDVAKGLTALYLTGQSLPEDSVCLHGSFLPCHVILADGLVRKQENAQDGYIGAMRIDPDKAAAHKLDQLESRPAVRPKNANRSPSGEQINAQPENVRKQKEAISKVKLPPAS